jgi:hypothetical protein
VKKQVEIIIFLFFGLTFLVCLLPFIFVDAAKVESGVTIKTPSTTEPEMICDPELRPPCRLLTNTSSTTEPDEICDDTIDNDNDGKIDADDEDCAAAPTGPAAGTCELQIVSGVPINYGQFSFGQEGFFSAPQKVTIKNVGTASAKIMIKGGNWISDAAGNTIRGPPEVTWVSFMVLASSKPLTSNERELGQLFGGQSLPAYFKIYLSGWPAGSYHQEVTIDLIC